MDVAIRLQALDLERHEAAFLDNVIDTDVVHELNENHLENLGLALGDRKRVQEAIAEKNPHGPTEWAREGELTAGDAFRIGFRALSVAERLSPPERLTGLACLYAPAVWGRGSSPTGHRR
jgi:SAM domain (Sterile alpha motif)